MIITFSECVLVALVIYYAMRMRHIVTCDLFWLYNIFPHFLTNGTSFGGKNLFGTKCVSIFSTTLSKKFHSKNNLATIGVGVIQ
jgi:hypothetical protein